MHLLFLLNSRIIGLLLHLLNDFFFFDLNDFLKLLSHKLTLIYFCFSRPSLLFKLFERFKLKLHIFEFVLEHFHFLFFSQILDVELFLNDGLCDFLRNRLVAAMGKIRFHF